MRSFGLFLIVFILAGCIGERSRGEPVLNGKWILNSARVNGKITDRLKDLYFEFSSDSLLETNLLGDTQPYIYSMENEQLYQRGDTDIEYAIEELTDTSLILKAIIQGSNFEFDMRRDRSTENPSY